MMVCAATEVLAAVADRGVTGENYAISIRPERLKFRSAAGAENGGEATLVSSTNLGASIRHRLTAGGHELQLREPSPDAAVVDFFNMPASVKTLLAKCLIG
ncbi:TOBE domain-containing protein [Micrococcaceae bacterium Sec5.7]